MNKRTSIIVTAYDTTIISRKITSACLACVNKYTDQNDYELILVDNSPLYDLNIREHFIQIDKRINNPENLGCSKANNQGVEISEGKYLCFLHSDVFVSDNWLSKLKYYLEKGHDVIYPHQGPTPRDLFLKWKSMPQKERYNERGTDDGGLILITREAFDKTGGWDERFKYLYHDYAFRFRMSKAQLNIKYAAELIITHIGGVAAIQDQDKLREMYALEAPIQQGLETEFKNL